MGQELRTLGLSLPFGRMRLRTLIAVLFTTLILLSVGVVSYLANRGVRETVDSLSFDLEARSLESVHQHLSTLLGRPAAVNGVNLAAVTTGQLSTADRDAMAHYMWRVGSIFPNIGTIAYGDSEGNFVGANRQENYFVLSDRERTGGAIRRYEPDPGGAFAGKVISERSGYDPRLRPWFLEAARAGQPAWTPVSLSVTTKRLDLTAATPWIEKGKVRGVFMVDLPLGKINDFLGELEIAKRGRVYVVEKNGLLIGSSDGAPYRENPGATPTRVAATEAEDQVIAGTAKAISARPGGFEGITEAFELAVDAGGEEQLVTAAPFKKAGGIDWVVVLTIPESRVFGAFRSNMEAISGFGILAVLLALVGSLILAWWVTKPLGMLTEAARDLAQGHWTEPRELDIPRGDEVGDLAESFNEMSSRLKVTMARLHSEMATSARQASELAESERRNRALLAAIPDVLFVATRRGELVEVYGSDSGLFGEAGPGETAHGSLSDLLPSHVAETIVSAISRTLDTGRMEISEFATTSRGEECHYEARIVVGGAAEALVLCRDITGERRAEGERQKLEQRLTEAQKMQAIGTLAGGVAHDFNNLLQVVAGRLELLRAAVGEGGGRESVAVIEKAVDRAAGLVQGLLTFAHKVERKRRPVDLNEEVRLTAQMIERTLPKMIEVRVNLADRLPPILADANQVQQVLLNLAANARDAMPYGGTLTIRTGERQPGPDFFRDHPEASAERFVALTVVDTGVGIPEESRRRIFEPFYTTKEVGKGTGLGLSIVYGIVRDHGGHIDLKSAPGDGATFTIYFPVTEAAESEDQKASAQPDTMVGGETVLVVDDEEEIGKMVSEGMRSMGFTVLTAKSGEECLEIHARMKGAIDLIVLDMGMPGMGGKACLTELRKVDRKVKVLVASGYGPQAEEEVEGMADGFIGKPYRMGDLVRKIREIERS